MSHGLFYRCPCYVSGPGNFAVVLLSMQGLGALGFHQKYLNLCSEDECRSYGYGTTWGWVINDSIFIFGWTIPLIFLLKNCNKMARYDISFCHHYSRSCCPKTAEKQTKIFWEMNESQTFRIKISTFVAPLYRWSDVPASTEAHDALWIILMLENMIIRFYTNL